MELGQSGFSPKTLRVPYGSAVVFRTSMDQSFWPASDTHPSHGIYDQFDPRTPINPSEYWTFVFNRSGRWLYHDHLEPNVRGEIIVRERYFPVWVMKTLSDQYRRRFEKHDDSFLDKVVSRCKTNNFREHMDCWNNFFSETLSDFGVSESMRILKLLFDRGQIGYADCHNFADEIGIQAYWIFAKDPSIQFHSVFSICYGGFLHGFMAEHISHGKNAVASSHLCETIDEQSHQMKNYCYAGFGSGLVFYYWSTLNKEMDKAVARSLEVCDDLELRVKDLCVYGVFGGVEHLYGHAHGYEADINIDDPFFLCDLQSNTPYRDYCYERILPPLFYLLERDILKINHWMQTIEDANVRKSLAALMGHILLQHESFGNSYDVASAISQCRKFSGDLSPDCTRGLFYDLFYTLEGRPNMFVDSSCEDIALTFEEQRICAEQKNIVIAEKKR